MTFDLDEDSENNFIETEINFLIKKVSLNTIIFPVLNI